MRNDYLMDVPVAFMTELKKLDLYLHFQGRQSGFKVPKEGGLDLKVAFSAPVSLEMFYKGTQQISGFAQIDSYFPSSAGTSYIRQAQSVSNLFRRGDVLKSNDTEIHIESVEVLSSPLSEGIQFKTPISINFNLTACED